MSVSLYSGPLNPVDEHFVEKAGSFAEEHLKPYAEQWEQTRQQPEKTLRMAISQFAGIRIPEELGGIGGSAAKGIAGFLIEADMPGVSAKPGAMDPDL